MLRHALPHPGRLLAVTWLAASALGCALPASLHVGPTAVTARGRVAVAQPGWRLAAVPTAKVAADVDAFEVEFWESTALDLADLEAEEAGVTKRALGEHGDPSAPLVIANLRQNATYGVRLTAHEGGVRIDDGSSACLTLIQTGLDDEVTPTFHVRLANTFFAGTAGGRIVVSGNGAAPYTAADVATTRIILHRLSTGDTIQADVAGTTPVTMHHLRRNTSYTVQLQALASSGARIDDCQGAASPACAVTFAVGEDDTIATPVDLPLVLRDATP